MKNIMTLFLLLSLFLSACTNPDSEPEVTASVESPPTSSTAGETNTESTAVAAEIENELPVLPELLGYSINDVSTEWGTVEGDGNVYRFKTLDDVVFIEEDNQITKISITGKDYDIYSSRVGQTLSEVKNSLGEPVYEGIDDMTDDYILQYDLNDTVSALYYLKDDTKPVFEIFLYITPTTEFVAEETHQPTTEHNVRAMLVGQTDLGVVIEIINAGMTPVENVEVSFQGLGYDSFGNNATPFHTANANRIEQGESVHVEVMTNYGGITIVDADIYKIVATPIQ